MKRLFFTFLILATISACKEYTPQRRAELAVEYWQKIILINLGDEYHSIDFQPLQIVYQSAKDSTVVGYTIDHRFSTVKNPTVREISNKRYYLNAAFNIVYASPNYPEIDGYPNDVKGIAAIKGLISDPW